MHKKKRTKVQTEVGQRHEILSDASVHKPSLSTLSGTTMQWELQLEGNLYSVEPEVP